MDLFIQLVGIFGLLILWVILVTVVGYIGYGIKNFVQRWRFEKNFKNLGKYFKSGKVEIPKIKENI